MSHYSVWVLQPCPGQSKSPWHPNGDEHARQASSGRALNEAHERHSDDHMSHNTSSSGIPWQILEQVMVAVLFPGKYCKPPSGGHGVIRCGATLPGQLVSQEHAPAGDHLLPAWVRA